MSNPHISIIIPCYNVAQYLAECLDSILAQTLSQWEAICVDDGSTDQTSDLLESYRQKDPRIFVFHQENQGAAAARNNAMRHATGTFIIFLDPDDFYPNEGTLELLYTKATEHNALICGGSFSNYNHETGNVRTCFGGDYAQYTFHKEGFVDYRDYQFDYGYHRFLYNRSFLVENDLFFPPYRRFQDPPFFAKAMIAAQRFYAIPDVVYRYRKGIQAAATTWADNKLHDMMRGYRDMITISAEHKLSQLHALTIRRFEEDSVLVPIVNSLRKGNETTSALLEQISKSISPALLKQCGCLIPANGNYTLRHYKQLRRTPSLARLFSRLHRLRMAVRATLVHLRRYGLRDLFRVLTTRNIA